MSVEGVLSSPSKVQVLRVLSDSSSAYSPQELEKETTKNISVIYDAVRELEEEGVIKSVKADGRKNYYRLNKDSSISKHVKQLFEAEKEEYGLEELPTHITNIILDAENKLRSKVEGIQLILLFGSMARDDFTPESDIDLYLVLDEKTIEKEDNIYDILDKYDREFSAVIRDEEGYQKEFGENHSELGNSILVEGYSILFVSDDIENLLNSKIDLKTLSEDLNEAWDIKSLEDYTKEEMNMKKLKDHLIDELHGENE
jgi:predicted nucleotidyltransferase